MILTGIDPAGVWVKNAFIISKKDSLISCYLYHFNVYDLPAFQAIPKGMVDYFKQTDTYKRHGDKIEASRFFNILKMSKDSTENLWQKVSALKPWQMGDDSVYGLGCPVERKRIVINTPSARDLGNKRYLFRV